VQAATTLLLYRLLAQLVGRRPGALVLLAWYAMNPLLLPGTIWLTTAVHLAGAQFFLVLALLAHLRYSRDGKLLMGVVSALALLSAVLFWEVSALMVLVLPVLSLGFLYQGSFGDRLRQALRRWPGWLAHLSAMVAWLGVFLTGSYGGNAHAFGPADAWEVVRVGWIDNFGPALLGGPWHWFWYGDVYFSVVDPPRAAVVLAQVVILAGLAVALLRTGWKALLALLMPLLVFVIGSIVVAVGRFFIYGDLSPKAPNYAFVLALPATLGLALALLPISAPGVPAPPRPLPRHGARFARIASRLPWHLRTAGIAVLCLAFLASTGVSGVSFTRRWAQSPTEHYLANLRAALKAAGPNVNLWDAAVPPNVLPFFAFGSYTSDILRLADLHARIQAPDSEPQIIRPDGSIGPAGLLDVATGVSDRHSPCTKLISGTGTWSIPLTITPGINAYFLKISYLQQRPSVLAVTMRDASGASLTPVGGARTALDAQLGNAYFRLPLGRPKALVLHSDNETMNVCVGAVQLGIPFPVNR